MDPHEATRTPFGFVLNDKTRLLAVDDDPIQLEFAKVYLTTPTASVDAVLSAEEALALIGANAYDAVLIDIDMPGMDGITLTRRLRANPATRDLPVVMVTGAEDVVSIDRSYEAGATSFVVKPVNWRLLSYHLRFVMRAEAERRALAAALRGAAEPVGVVRPRREPQPAQDAA